MKLTATSTLTDVAFEVCSALAERGFVAVLTGGSAATFHAPDAYVSRHLDFVLTLRGTLGEEALRAIGYERVGNFYRHAVAPFPLDFPPGPLAVGEEVITQWATHRRGAEVLHVLKPHDSVRDRLASWLFWNDLNGLEQALAVHLAHEAEVSLDALRDWAQRANQPRQFEAYEQRFVSASPTE